jgi:hypothetical protein
LKSKKLLFFSVLIIFLIFLKSDFRIINDLQCCNDDYDYFSHASTIADDFDFDYSNQLIDKSRYFQNDKNAPFGFLGTGLLSAPFLFIGGFIDNLTNYTGVKQLSIKYLSYSFSSIFYFLGSLILIRRIQEFYNTNLNYLLYFLGSGITYYVFERYSMTPIYEVFTILFVIYLTQQFIIQESRREFYSLLIPISILLAILVRWTNLFVFLIPIIVLLSHKNFTYQLIRKLFNKFFFISLIVNFVAFLYLSKQIYGVITFSPSYIYMVNEFDGLVYENILGSFFEFVAEFIKDFFIINFSQEFGLFWFSPIIFLSTFFVIYRILVYKNFTTFLLYFLISLCFLQNFFIVSIWNSTAASYGFRYLFSLIPLSFLVLFMNSKILDNKLFLSYLKYFSIFAFLATLLFDATELTTLSLEPVVNSFGYKKVYSQPNYLEGVIKSIFEIDAYRKIIATSYFFIFGIEIFINQFDFGKISEYIYVNSLQNSDLENLLIKIKDLTDPYFVFTIVAAVLFCSQLIKHIHLKKL